MSELSFLFFGEEENPVEKAQKTAKAVEAVNRELTDRGIFAYVLNADSLPEAEQRLANREIDATINDLVARYMPGDEGAKARLVSSIFKQFEAAKDDEDDDDDDMPMKDGKPAFLSDDDSDEDEDDSEDEDDDEDEDEDDSEDDEDDDEDNEDDSSKKEARLIEAGIIDKGIDTAKEKVEDFKDRRLRNQDIRIDYKRRSLDIDMRARGLACDNCGVATYPSTNSPTLRSRGYNKTICTDCSASPEAAESRRNSWQDRTKYRSPFSASTHLAEGTIDPRLPNPFESPDPNCAECKGTGISVNGQCYCRKG